MNTEMLRTIMEIAGKATPRQFLSNFKELTNLMEQHEKECE